MSRSSELNHLVHLKDHLKSLLRPEDTGHIHTTISVLEGRSRRDYQVQILDSQNNMEAERTYKSFLSFIKYMSYGFVAVILFATIILELMVLEVNQTQNYMKNIWII